MPAIVQTDAALRAVLPRLEAAARVALDTEFHTERRYEPVLMLVQVRADDDEPVLIDPLAPLDLAPLGEVLARVPVVVHGGGSDLALLARATGRPPNVVFDTQVAAGFVGDGFPARLQQLVATHLGESLDKTQTLSDWSRRPLTRPQLVYAAGDVLVLGRLQDRLREGLARRGHTAAAEAALAEVVTASLAPERDEEAWRALPGVRGLGPEEVPRARALARWRQAAARERAVPRHAVLSDAILVDLARRHPRDLDALRSNRRLPSAVWKQDGPALLTCLEQAAAEPAPPPLAPRGFTELVRAWARAEETRTGVAAELLLPDSVVDALWSGVHPSGWRAPLLGEDFLAFLRGDAGVFLPAGLRPFARS